MNSHILAKIKFSRTFLNLQYLESDLIDFFLLSLTLHIQCKFYYIDIVNYFRHVFDYLLNLRYCLFCGLTSQRTIFQSCRNATAS